MVSNERVLPRSFVRQAAGSAGGFTIEPSMVAVGSLFVSLLSLKSLLSFAELVHGDLVDLGCGTAPHRVWYEGRVSSVTRVDWPGSPHDVAHVDVLADLNERLPLESESADTVILTSVLEHLRSPQTALAEVRRILRPQGVALIQVPFLYHVHEAPHDYFRYTRFGLDELLQSAGLRVVAGEAYGNLAAVLVDLGAKGGELIALGLGRYLPSELGGFARDGVVSLVRLLQLGAYEVLRQPHARRLSDALGNAERFPLGYTIVATPEAGA